MIKTCIRIFFVLTLSLVLISGSAGAVNAKNAGRFMRIDLIQAHWDMSGPTFILPSASFSYNHIGVWAYEYQWFTQAPEYDAPWEPFGDMEYVSFGSRQSSGTNIDLPLPALPWPHVFNGKGKVVVHLFNKKGNYIHGFGPPEPVPAIAWHSLGSLTFWFSGYDASGYKYQWYHDGAPLGDTQYSWFGGIQTSGSNLPIIDYRGGQGRYTVEVWLIKTNGHKIPGAYITAGWTAF